MAISLQSLQKTQHAKPPRLVIHGSEKVGKSTFFSQAPAPVFIQTEDGLSGVDATAFPLATKLHEVFEAVDSLLTEDHSFQSVIIDSADWLERLIHDQVCIDYNVTTIEKAAGGYGKGYLEGNNYWRKLLGKLDQLNQRGLIIGIICHSRITTINDPETEPYDTHKMKLHSPKSGQGAMELLNEWADVIGFAAKRTMTVKRQASDTAGYRGTTTHERLLHLEGTPAYLAGNRYGLPATIQLSWQAFESAFAQSQNSNSEAA